MAANSEKLATAEANRYWTNERHVHFLNSIEDSFVRSVFGRNRPRHRPPPPPPRLDRYLPDSADSTLDLVAKRRRVGYSTGSDDVDDESSYGRRKAHKALDEDQVVPQMPKPSI